MLSTYHDACVTGCVSIAPACLVSRARQPALMTVHALAMQKPLCKITIGFYVAIISLMEN